MSEEEEKLINLIKNFNKKIDCLINNHLNFKKNNYDDLIKMEPRKIIEGLILILSDGKIKINNFLKERFREIESNKDKEDYFINKILIPFRKINEPHHFLNDYDLDLKDLINEFYSLSNYICDFYKKTPEYFGIKNFLFNVQLKENWITNNKLLEDEKYKKYKKYNAFIIKKQKINSNTYLYEIANYKKNWSQKNRNFIYSLKGDILELFNFYELEFNIQYLKENEKFKRVILENKKIYFPTFFMDNKIIKDFDKELIEWRRNLIEKYGFSPWNLIFKKYIIFKSINLNFLFEEEFNKLLIILKNIYNNSLNNDLKDYFFKNLIILKHFDQKNLEENSFTDSKFTPLVFEYWTKNNRGKKPFTLYEKEIIYELILKNIIENISINEKPFLNKENAKFNNELNFSGLHYIDFSENLFKKLNNKNNQNSFNEKYEELKIFKEIIDYKEVLITGKNKNLIKSIEKLLEKRNFKNKWYKKNKNLYKKNEKLSPRQKELFEFAINNSRTLILGPPGSGKSWLAYWIIREIQKNNETIAFLGPTHKSAKIINEFSKNDSEIFKNTYTIDKIIHNKILLENIDNVIIDEFSMIKDNQWIELSKLIETKKRIIIMGDQEQLPPIQSIGISWYIVKRAKELHILQEKLREENHRQKNEELKQKINYFRENRVFNNQTSSNFIIRYSTVENYVQKINDFKKKKFTFLSPINNSIYGIRNISELFDTYEIGDEIIIKSNIENYDSNIYYGKKLKIINIDKKNKYVKKIYFDYKELKNPEKILSTENDYFHCEKINNKYEFWYENNYDEEDIILPIQCYTIHLSQGSTFSKILLILPPHFLDDENYFKKIYTAISRCKEEFRILIYKEDVSKILKQKKQRNFLSVF